MYTVDVIKFHNFSCVLIIIDKDNIICSVFDFLRHNNYYLDSKSLRNSLFEWFYQRIVIFYFI